MMLLSCSNTQDVLLASQPIKSVELPKLPSAFPPINPTLLVACYDDSLPLEPASNSVADLIKNDTDNHVKYNNCYHRQYRLILEVIIREMDK